MNESNFLRERGIENGTNDRAVGVDGIWVFVADGLDDVRMLVRHIVIYAMKLNWGSLHDIGSDGVNIIPKRYCILRLATMIQSPLKSYQILTMNWS